MIDEIRECGVVNTIRRMFKKEKRMPLQPEVVDVEEVDIVVERRRGL